MSPANVSSSGNTNEKATTRPDGVSQKTHTKQVITHTESCSTTDTSKQAFLEVRTVIYFPFIHNDKITFLKQGEYSYSQNTTTQEKNTNL
jgi:hypothetical protein